jgi:hypothetical protein
MSGFGSVRDDLIGILAIACGGDREKAEAKIDELEALIRSEAKTGALEAEPQIRAAVKKEMTPYVIAALSLGVLSLLVGVGTVLYVRKRRP